MAKLSVVVSVYNTNIKYLRECFQCIFDSSFKDLEVIMIDDGSSVDYSAVLKEFKDIKYFKIENQGILNARIVGVKKASSDYVCIVDADDTMSFNYFEANMSRALETNADVVINDWAFHTNKTKYVCINDSNINSTYELDGDAFLNKFFKQAGKEHSYYVLWNKLYKREIILKACEKIASLDYYTNIKFAEDVIINYFVFSQAKKVANVHLGYYFYRIHTSQHVSVQDIEKLKLIVVSMTNIFNTIENSLIEKGCFDEFKENFQKWKQLICSVNCCDAKKFKQKEIFDYIFEKYKNCEMKKLPNDYGKVYVKHKILPINLKEIDEQLKKISFSKKHLKVYANKNSYAYEMLKKAKNLLNKPYILTKIKKEASIVMPKEIYSLKQKILHNSFVYRIGMKLFPKGSKIRQKLKSKL